MTDRSSGQALNRKNYQHPHEDTVCGHLAAGAPCAIGPGHCGECRVEQICQPWFNGTQWHCTRAKAFGGRCADGPVPDPENPEQSASCPHCPPACQPARTVRSKRRLVSGLVAAGALGICLLIIGGSSGNTSTTMFSTTAIVSPGPLSAHHATMQQGCSACHSAADQSTAEIINCLFGSTGGIEESHRCLECHSNLGEFALHPHSLPPESLRHATEQLLNNATDTPHTAQQVLARMLTAPSRTSSGELACASCHREHQGAEFDLTAMTNAQCQSCHTATFHSLSDGHPEFPERPRADLHFDHVTHLNLHFRNFERTMPDGTPRMRCQNCHTPDSSGAMMNLQSFDVMCASCHEPQIRDFDAEPPARLHEFVFLDWAAINMDASQGPAFMELLLAADQLRSADIDQLADNLLHDGEETIRRRLHMLTDTRTESTMIESCITALERAHFFDAVEMQTEIEPLELGKDDALYGSWRIADGGNLLIYDCNQHADDVIRAWIDLAADNARQFPDSPETGNSGTFDRLLRELGAPESTGRCLKCHTLEPKETDGFRVNWKSSQGTDSGRSFTRFSHKPHLTLLSSQQEIRTPAAEQRCESCHALDHDSFGLVNSAFTLEDGMPRPEGTECAAVGMKSTTRVSCARCHTPELAGDNCLQCHQYHIHD